MRGLFLVSGVSFRRIISQNRNFFKTLNLCCQNALLEELNQFRVLPEGDILSYAKWPIFPKRN